MWEQIRSNQTRSAILVFGMGAVWLLLGFVFGLLTSYITPLDRFESVIYGIIFASVLWVFITLAAYFHGDSILLALSKAKKISSNDLRRIYNIVEELKIASGLETMPSIYIIDDPALNAFAVGRDPNKDAIIVTSGLLTKLNRDELQGVIGHEIAHIKNRDVLLMSLCITLLGTMNIVTWIFSPKRLLLFIGGLLLISPGLVIVAFGLMGGWGIMFNMWSLITIFLFIPALMLLMPFMAKLIYFAISRRREYLADASSALYTRYPEGLASALEKIAASTNQLLSANPATAPIYIVNPFRKRGMAASDLTSTHPPISERIRILRSMAHVSYTDYDRAYRQIRGTDKSVIPAAAVASAGVVPMRAAMSEDLNHIQRARETTNVLWNLNNYKIISCLCGTRLRLPPSFKLSEVRCPHCGRMNSV
ncbi:MAG: M48 family metallopeptidase [Chloroflexi bacterium]|nr:M48 family metallopeptidase [Chloroflexota bacterium]